MYFTILNILLGVFFAFLIGIGMILKYWLYIPPNALGIIGISIALYLNLSDNITPGMVVSISLVLIAIIIFNLIVTHRDFKEDISEGEAKKRRKYIFEGIEYEHFKLLKDEEIIKGRIEQHKKVPLSERIQAFEMLKLGNEAFIKHNYQEALDKYKLSVDWVNTSIGYLNQSGVLIKLKKYKQALNLAEQASEIQPNFYEAILNQAVALEKLKKYNKALIKYNAAAKISPVEHEIWFCIANVLFKQKRYKEAAENYNKSLDLYGRQFQAWYYKGIALENIGNEIEALHSYKQAINLKSNHAKIYFRTGNILCRLNRDLEAIAAYEKAITINSESAEVWNNLGLTLNKVGRRNDAIKCYDRAININPEFYEAWLNKGLAHDSIRNFKKAYFSYNNYLQLAPKESEKRIAIAKNRALEIKKKYKIKERKKVKKSIIIKRIKHTSQESEKKSQTSKN